MSAVTVRAPRSEWRSAATAASMMLRQTAPWVLVVLVATSLLFTGGAAWGTWSGAPPDNYLEVRGDQGVAAIVSGPVALATLFIWVRTVRTAVPALVAGGVTRRAVTGGLLVAAVALAVVTTAMLTLVAVAGAALQRWVAGISPGRFEIVNDNLAYASSLTFTVDEGLGYFNPAATLPWLVMAALVGALFSAAWYRWRAPGVVGVLVLLGVVWSVCLGVAGVPAGAVGLMVTNAWPRTPFLHLGISAVLAAAVWLVLRRVPLRPPAR